MTITRFVAFYYSVFTGHVVGPCADPGATQAEDLHGAGYQDTVVPHLKIQKVIGDLDEEGE